MNVEVASQDISVALEIEKKCLYFMSRETNTELANLKVSTGLCDSGNSGRFEGLSNTCLQEEEARYERLVKLFQDQIDALETSPKQLAPHAGSTSDARFNSVDHNTMLQK